LDFAAISLTSINLQKLIEINQLNFVVKQKTENCQIQLLAAAIFHEVKQK